jgi:hypothetical protein
MWLPQFTRLGDGKEYRSLCRPDILRRARIWKLVCSRYKRMKKVKQSAAFNKLDKYRSYITSHSLAATISKFSISRNSLMQGVCRKTQESMYRSF